MRNKNKDRYVVWKLTMILESQAPLPIPLPIPPQTHQNLAQEPPI